MDSQAAHGEKVIGKRPRASIKWTCLLRSTDDLPSKISLSSFKVLTNYRTGLGNGIIFKLNNHWQAIRDRVKEARKVCGSILEEQIKC